MACWDERPGGRRRLPLQPAITPRGRVRERLGPPASARRRERGALGVGRLARSQDLESAGSAKAAMCAAHAGPPPSGFPLRPRQRNIEDVVIPFLLPCFSSIAPSLAKYAQRRDLQLNRPSNEVIGIR